jgi:hypothetical protein
MAREEMIAMAEEAGLKVDSRWSDETLAKKLGELTEPEQSDEEVGADNALNSMGEPLVKVVCTTELGVHLGNGEVLKNREKAELPESVAKFLESRDQVVIV